MFPTNAATIFGYRGKELGSFFLGSAPAEHEIGNGHSNVEVLYQCDTEYRCCELLSGTMPKITALC